MAESTAPSKKPTKAERTLREGLRTACSPRWTDINVNMDQRYAVSRVELAGIRCVRRFVLRLFEAATTAYDTGGLVQPYDVLWLARALEGEYPHPKGHSTVVAFASQPEKRVQADGLPVLRMVWVASMYEPFTWGEPLVETVKTYHCAQEVAWQRLDLPRVLEVAVAAAKDGRVRR